MCLFVSGYLRITDFGIARIWREENAQDTSGTPGYMAPEVMCRQNHTTSVDYFAVGVMAYECMFGRVSTNPLTKDSIEPIGLVKQYLSNNIGRVVLGNAC